MIKIKSSTILITLATAILIIFVFIKLINGQIGTSKIVVGGKTIDVEIADTDEERTKGLSNHEALQENEGMLFVFDQNVIPTFWMKDMLFDLDFIWIRNGTVVDLTENVSHNDQRRLYSPREEIDQVLEVSAGYVKKHNIKNGDRVIENF